MSNKYIFKCTYNKGESSCNGEHVINFDDILCGSLVYRLMFIYKMNFDKEFMFKILAEFKEFIENKKNDNEIGKNDWSHWSSMDIEAELLYGFTNLKFGLTPNEKKRKRTCQIINKKHLGGL